jgi:hypothetical protein
MPAGVVSLKAGFAITLSVWREPQKQHGIPAFLLFLPAAVNVLVTARHHFPVKDGIFRVSPCFPYDLQDHV